MADWGGPLFRWVGEFPKGLVVADGLPQSACGSTRCWRVCPRHSLSRTALNVAVRDGEVFVLNFLANEHVLGVSGLALPSIQ